MAATCLFGDPKSIKFPMAKGWNCHQSSSLWTVVLNQKSKSEERYPSWWFQPLSKILLKIRILKLTSWQNTPRENVQEVGGISTHIFQRAIPKGFCFFIVFCGRKEGLKICLLVNVPQTSATQGDYIEQRSINIPKWPKWPNPMLRSWNHMKMVSKRDFSMPSSKRYHFHYSKYIFTGSLFDCYGIQVQKRQT